MIGARALRRKQQEHEIDRLVVQRLEIDRLLQPSKDADDRMDVSQLAVGNGDAVADAGRAQAFALQDNVEDLPFGKPGDLAALAANS